MEKIQYQEILENIETVDEAQNHIVNVINNLSLRANRTAWEKGFYDDYESTLDIMDSMSDINETVNSIRKRYATDFRLSKIAMIASGIGELVEAVRKPSYDKHCVKFTSEEIEAADIMIRLLDYSREFGIRIGEALMEKMSYNKTGPYMHGKGA